MSTLSKPSSQDQVYLNYSPKSGVYDGETLDLDKDDLEQVCPVWDPRAKNYRGGNENSRKYLPVYKEPTENLKLDHYFDSADGAILLAKLSSNNNPDAKQTYNFSTTAPDFLAALINHSSNLCWLPEAIRDEKTKFFTQSGEKLGKQGPNLKPYLQAQQKRFQALIDDVEQKLGKLEAKSIHPTHLDWAKKIIGVIKKSEFYTGWGDDQEGGKSVIEQKDLPVTSRLGGLDWPVDVSVKVK